MVDPIEFKNEIGESVSQDYKIEFHLGNHKYYDKIRKDLTLKKGDY